MEKAYKVPAVVWLKMAEYMHGWLQSELGGEARVTNQKVVCIQHLPGARQALRMESCEDATGIRDVGNSMSSTRRNCITSGLKIDPEAMLQEFGMTDSLMREFVPVECPKMCLTRKGVLRPWTNDIGFSHQQATALQRILRREFWKAVEEFDKRYAKRMNGGRYPAVDMIEAFCQETQTPDLHVEAIRREWQRRVKRSKQ